MGRYPPKLLRFCTAQPAVEMHLRNCYVDASNQLVNKQCPLPGAEDDEQPPPPTSARRDALRNAERAAEGDSAPRASSRKLLRSRGSAGRAAQQATVLAAVSPFNLRRASGVCRR